MSLQDGGYTQGQLTFIDPDGLYGADTQGLDYGFELTPLSQSQTQSSQLTQPNGGPGVAVDRKITKGKKDYENYNNNGFILNCLFTGSSHFPLPLLGKAMLTEPMSQLTLGDDDEPDGDFEDEDLESSQPQELPPHACRYTVHIIVLLLLVINLVHVL